MSKPVESSSASATAPAWTEAPPAAVADDESWLSRSDQDKSLARDLREIFRDELWGYRGLTYELTRRDIRVRYKQTLLGFAWAVLMPTVIVLAGAMVRFAMAQMGGRSLAVHELAGIAIKAVPWSFFVGALGFATNSLVGNNNLVTKIYFPREVLPLAATLAQGFDSLVGGFTLLLVCAALGLHYGWAAWWAPLLAVCTVMLTAGLGLLVGCANVFFRDVKYVVQVVLTFGIFFTPVFVEPEMLGATGARLMMLNPLAPLLEGFRLSVVYDHNLLDTLVVMGRRGAVLTWSPWYLAYSLGWALVLFMVGLVTFHRFEAKFAEHV